MKKRNVFLWSFAASMLVIGTMLLGQAVPTYVAHIAAHYDACTETTFTGAVNASVGGTLAPVDPSVAPNVEICGVHLNVANDSTGLVTQQGVQFTTTNLNGLKWTYSSANAANTNGYDLFESYPTHITAATAGAVNFASPAANTHAQYTMSIFYKYVKP